MFLEKYGKINKCIAQRKEGETELEKEKGERVSETLTGVQKESQQKSGPRNAREYSMIAAFNALKRELCG